MAASNLHLAPSPKAIDGLYAVPIDIQQLHVSAIFNGATLSASVIAALTFITGNQNGCPVFDLRQPIATAMLDGISIPVSDLAFHNFGGGANSEMRILNKVLTAGTSHSLTLTYTLGPPQSPAGGGYPPNYNWSAGPRLILNFGYTDLAPARYLEAWFPANLIYDQFDIEMDIQLTNTSVSHSVISNASVTFPGTNHWKLNFPSRFTALSSMLEIRATDTLQHLTDMVVLPVSGNTVTIDAWKLATSSINLSLEINHIKTFLSDNENSTGQYLHGNHFTVFFNMGGMEYEGSCTAVPGTLKHETFHSWWARGIKPASQSDSWLDEAWATYFCDYGGINSLPLDFTSSPIELCTQNKWSRITVGNSYSDGYKFWQGISSLIGNVNLKAFMKDFYSLNKNELIKTQTMEEYLLCRSGNTMVVDAFHRFVYGFSDPSSIPDLWLKDDETDALGSDNWSGRFWDSPDIWVRNYDDNITDHQNPISGQDNWLYARVRNKSSVTVKHFVVTFNVKQFAGTQFSYPVDFLPCIAAASGFELAAGANTVVKARWTGSLVPPSDTHACLLTSVITRSEHPTNTIFVWESNNLAQKNLTIIHLKVREIFLLPFIISNYLFKGGRSFGLEIFRPANFPGIPVTLVHTKPGLFSEFEKVTPYPVVNKLTDSDSLFEMHFAEGKSACIQVTTKFRNQLLVRLKIQVPQYVKAGENLRFDLVQRDIKTRKIIGGIALIVNVVA